MSNVSKTANTCFSFLNEKPTQTPIKKTAIPVNQKVYKSKHICNMNVSIIYAVIIIVLLLMVTLFSYLYIYPYFRLRIIVKNNSNHKVSENVFIIPTYPWYKLYHLSIFNLKQVIKQNFQIKIVSSINEYKKLISNEKIKRIIVFGHGSKHSLKIQKEIFYYCELSKLTHIEFYGQLHCNHDDGRTAYEIIGCRGYSTNKAIHIVKLNREFKNIIENLLKNKRKP